MPHRILFPGKTVVCPPLSLTSPLCAFLHRRDACWYRRNPPPDGVFLSFPRRIFLDPFCSLRPDRVPGTSSDRIFPPLSFPKIFFLKGFRFFFGLQILRPSIWSDKDSHPSLSPQTLRTVRFSTSVGLQIYLLFFSLSLF